MHQCSKYVVNDQSSLHNDRLYKLNWTLEQMRKAFDKEYSNLNNNIAVVKRELENQRKQAIMNQMTAIKQHFDATFLEKSKLDQNNVKNVEQNMNLECSDENEDVNDEDISYDEDELEEVNSHIKNVKNEIDTMIKNVKNILHDYQ